MTETRKTPARPMLSPDLADKVREIAERERRNFTNTVEILLIEALTAREGIKK